MPKHDHQAANNETSSAHFNGEDIEFAPFMFDPSPEAAETAHGTFKDVDMEFEPFMFNPGEGLMLSGQPSAMSQEVSMPSEPMPAVMPFAPAPAAPSMPTEPATTPQAPVMPIQPLVSATPAMPTEAQQSAPQSSSTKPDLTADTPFAGHDVPVPTYLQPTPDVSTMPSVPVLADNSAGAEMPGWSAPAAQATPVTGPMTQDAMRNTSPSLSTGPVHETGPINTETPAALVAAAPTPTFTGMAGRSRGNTGPLSATLPNASWSDSSLASIEDFSSVLIAMQAGKRLRQSSPLNETMVSQTGAAPSTATATATQPDVPEWAAQAVATLTSTAPTTDMQANQTAQQEGAPAWASNWEPQLPADMSVGGVSPLENMPAQVQGESLPPWSMNPPTEPPEATSWTGAQAQPEETSLPGPPPVPGSSEKAMAELAAIMAMTGDQQATLDPGIADTLEKMNSGIAEGSVKGDDIEFEGFMFDQGTAAPLRVLPATDAAAASGLPQDMGPVFDPAPYLNPVQAEETHEYGDADGMDFGQSGPMASVIGSAPGSLPFWLQEKPQVPQAGLQGEAAMQAQQNLASQTTGDSGAAAVSEDFTDLPPIDPFDFSLVSGADEGEEFGFNTDELIGLMPGGRDPMVVTANLEALADLMSGPGGIPADLRPNRQHTQSSTEADMHAAPQSEAAPMREAAADAGTDIATGFMQTQSAEPAVMPVEQALPAEVSEGNAGGEGEDDESKAGGWMATVTTGLTMDSISSLTGNLEASATNAEMVVEDLDVTPFDYAKLDLDVEEETPTSNLMSGNLQGERTGQLEAIIEQMAEAKSSRELAAKATAPTENDTSLYLQTPAEQQAEAEAEAEAPEMPTGYLREETRDASEATTVAVPEVQDAGQIVKTPQPFNTEDMASLGDGVPETAGHGPAVTAQVPETAAPPAVGQGPDVVDEAAPQEDTVFRARVASGAWGDAPAVSEPQQQANVPAAETGQATQPEPEQAAKEASDGYGVGVRKAARTKVLTPVERDASQGRWDRASDAAGSQGGTTENADGQVQFEEEYVPKMPAQGDILTSGPLPTLDGFEDLTAWIERYPQDMGAHMALASAYTQAGDIDTALRVYRRMLRKPSVSDNVLRMVQEELNDLEEQASQYPRYHQVRGDLLVRQGHRREAIEEYNKLG
jgi:pentatricopeptide repeat protein